MDIKDIESAIINQFGDDSIIDLNVVQFGTLVDVDLTYLDGPTLSSTRKWLESHIPMLWHCKVDRSFSDATLSHYHLNEDTEQGIQYAHNYLFNIPLS